MSFSIVPNNTGKTAHIAWADVATANQSVGTAIVVNDGSTKKRGVRFWVKIGRRSGTAFTAGWPNIRFEASHADSGNLDWFTLYSYQVAVGASIANTTLNGAVSANATSIVVTSATNIAAGDMLFIKGNSDSENEVVRVKTVSGTTVTLDDATPVVAAKNSGNAVTDQAEQPAPFAFGCESIRRIRAVVDNAGGGQTVAVEITYSTFDAEYSP